MIAACAWSSLLEVLTTCAVAAAVRARAPSTTGRHLLVSAIRREQFRGLRCLWIVEGYVQVLEYLMDAWKQRVGCAAADRLAILGSYPPPFGGVATHTKRLLPLLESAGIEARVYNAVSSAEAPPQVVSVYAHRHRWLVDFAVRGGERAVYVLSDRIEAWALLAASARLRGKRLAIRLRNSVVPDLLQQGGPRLATAAWALRQADLVVGVSALLTRCAQDLGVPPEKTLHQPGFLAPTAAETDEALIDAPTRAFMEAHQPLIAANGKVNWYRGEDLYGLDLLVSLVAKLKPAFPRLGLVVCFWDHQPRDASYLQTLKDNARAAGIAEQIHFRLKPKPFVPVLKQAQLFVRPTRTDGDANSVREALHLGVPALASDVVERPDGAKLFPSGNAEALATAAAALLLDQAALPRSVAAPRDALAAKTAAYTQALGRLLA